jgi:DNA (cytosine-5)-methyltransferase 1
MTQPRLLDLFSGAGGAARGYQLAGFHVTGVDIKPQPRYAGDVFIQGDALDYCREHGHEFDVIHASPPCQHYTSLQVLWRNEHPDLVAATRSALIATERPYVIENVVGAPLELGLAERRGYLKRHRLFESGPSPFLPILTTPCDHPQGVRAVGVYGHTGESTKRGSGNHFWYVPDWKEAMGIDWMTGDELAQAIPPAYCEFIGRQLMTAITHSEPEQAARSAA